MKIYLFIFDLKFSKMIFYILLPIECIIATLPLLLTIVSIIYFCNNNELGKNNLVINQNGRLDLTRLESASSYDSSLMNNQKKLLLRNKISIELSSCDVYYSKKKTKKIDFKL